MGNFNTVVDSICFYRSNMGGKNKFLSPFLIEHHIVREQSHSLVQFEFVFIPTISTRECYSNTTNTV